MKKIITLLLYTLGILSLLGSFGITVLVLGAVSSIWIEGIAVLL